MGCGKCRNVCTTENNIRICEAACKSCRTDGNYFVQVYVAVVMPQVDPTGSHSFDLCQDGKCVNSGTVSTFGGTTAHTTLKPDEVVGDERFHIVEVDVTDVMVKEGWSFKKSLEAKMINKVMKNLPEPVVIIKTFGKGRQIKRIKLRFSPNDKREHFGNLLDKYSS